MKSLFIFLALAAALTGCGVPYKKLAAECARLYPPRDSITVRDTIVYDTLYFPDYTLEFVDTTNCPPNLTDTLRIVKTVAKLVPISVPVQIPRRDSLIYVRDLAKEKAQADRIAQLEKDLQKQRLRAAGTGGWKWAFWVLLAAVIAFISYTLSRRFRKS
jgi:hypothetical protein